MDIKKLLVDSHVLSAAAELVIGILIIRFVVKTQSMQKLCPTIFMRPKLNITKSNFFVNI